MHVTRKTSPPWSFSYWKTKVSQEAFWRALRCGTATAVPALLAGITGQRELGWAALGGFEAVIADLGGSYRTRLIAMSLLSLGGAAGVFLGSLISHHLLLTFFVTTVWCFCWAYASSLGGTVKAFNILLIVIYLAGVGSPAENWREAATHAGYLLGGGLWAMLLSFFVWPIHPYRPARRAVGECYSGLVVLLDDVENLSSLEKSEGPSWRKAARQHQFAMRNALENARKVIGETRRLHMAETLRGEQMLILLESADVLLGYTIAVSDLAERTREHPECPSSRELLQFIPELRKALQWIARTAKEEPQPIAKERVTFCRRLRSAVAIAKAEAGTDLDGRSVAHLAQLCADAAEVALSAVYAVRTGEAPPPASVIPQGPGHRTIGLPSRHMLDTLRAEWTWESLTLRYATRVGVLCGLGILIAMKVDLDHGYWVPMTSALVLQPKAGATRGRSMQRVIGTIAGGILAALLVSRIYSEIVLALLLFPLAFATLVTLPINYTAYAVLLTPTFVIAWLPHPGDWQLALVRMMNTAIGGVIAIPATYTLWPRWEYESFHKEMARAAQIVEEYLRTLRSSWSENGITPIEIARARRQMGIVLNQAEDALDQLLRESKTAKDAREPALTFITYSRRLGQSITTLHSTPHMPGQESAETLSVLDSFADRVANVVARLDRGEWTALPRLQPRTIGFSEVQSRLDVLDRQVGVLEDSARRYLANRATVAR